MLVKYKVIAGENN